MTKIKNRCCYTVTLILCGTLFLTGLTGCKSREAQFLIEGLQESMMMSAEQLRIREFFSWQPGAGCFRRLRRREDIFPRQL